MDSKHLEIGVPIFLGSQDAGSQFEGFQFKGFQCAPDSPPASYALTMSGDRRIRLSAVSERCNKRRELLEGVWEGVD
jgi:hypothetical protein